MTLQESAGNETPKHANATTADSSQNMYAWRASQTQRLFSTKGRQQAAPRRNIRGKRSAGAKEGRQTSMNCNATENERCTMTGAPRDSPTTTDLLVDTHSHKTPPGNAAVPLPLLPSVSERGEMGSLSHPASRDSGSAARPTGFHMPLGSGAVWVVHRRDVTRKSAFKEANFSHSGLVSPRERRV